MEAAGASGQQHFQQAAQGDDGQLEFEDKDLEVSLYDLIRYYREEVGQPLARLFYSASFKEMEKGPRQDFINSIASSVKSLRTDGKRVTGFLQIRGNYLIHILEAENQVLYDFLKNLHTETKAPKTPYERVNVLLLSEELAEECFPDWEYDDVFQSGAISTEFDKTDAMLDKIWNVYSGLCKVGIKLRDKLKRDNKLSKQVWRELTSEVPISNEDLSIMLHPGYLGLDDYVRIYESDLDIVLDDELSYPQPPKLSKILEFFDSGTYI
jgi:hypothetical protein